MLRLFCSSCLVFGFMIGPKRSERPVGFIWSKFQAKRSIPDLFRNRFDVSDLPRILVIPYLSLAGTLGPWPSYEAGSDGAKISMLRLNNGSGMLRLSSCMLSIGLGPTAVRGKRGGGPLALFALGSKANAKHA